MPHPSVSESTKPLRSATYGCVHPDSANKPTPIMYNYGVQVGTIVKLTNLTAVAGSFYPSICNHTAHYSVHLSKGNRHHASDKHSIYSVLRT